MATSRRWFSKQELVQLFVFCAFPIHVWTIVNMLNDVPAWVVFMNLADLSAVIAYTLAFALVETLLVVLVFVALGMLIPLRWRRAWFIPFSNLLILELAFLGYVLHKLIQTPTFSKWYAVLAFAPIAALTLAFAIRSRGLPKILQAAGDRLGVLTAFYVSFDVLGLIMVLMRNLVG